MPRKQRHTAKRIWERLREAGFTGGYTVVKEAVREFCFVSKHHERSASRERQTCRPLAWRCLITDFQTSIQVERLGPAKALNELPPHELCGE